MENKKFEKPELIVINFVNDDIITDSVGNPDCGYLGDENCG